MNKSLMGQRICWVEALAMAASAVKICSRKKVKASGLSELEKILLGYYIKFGPRISSHAYILE